MPKQIEVDKNIENYKEKVILMSSIDYLRKMQGVSEKSLMVSAKMSPFQYRKCKKDPGEFKNDNLLRIAKRLHTTVADLLVKREVIPDGRNKRA